MGFVKLPTTCDYWSNKSAFRGHSIYESEITRIRFEQLLTHIHQIIQIVFTEFIHLFNILNILAKKYMKKNMH